MPKPSHKRFEGVLFLGTTIYLDGGLPSCTKEKRIKIRIRNL